MAKAGRKARAGKRTASGRLSRAGAMPAFDKGTEHAQAMTALYGQDGSDAIGRAFRSGLLGEGSEAKALLDLARTVAKAYWTAYETGRYTCADIDHERIKRREVWLTGAMDAVTRLGVRRAFNQLVIDPNPDSGPSWLDALCYAKRQGKPADPGDATSLRKALEGLDAIGG
jgi:hypothetical protein